MLQFEYGRKDEDVAKEKNMIYLFYFSTYLQMLQLISN